MRRRILLSENEPTHLVSPSLEEIQARYLTRRGELLDKLAELNSQYEKAIYENPGFCNWKKDWEETHNSVKYLDEQAPPEIRQPAPSKIPSTGDKLDYLRGHKSSLVVIDEVNLNEAAFAPGSMVVADVNVAGRVFGHAMSVSPNRDGTVTLENAWGGGGARVRLSPPRAGVVVPNADRIRGMRLPDPVVPPEELFTNELSEQVQEELLASGGNLIYTGTAADDENMLARLWEQSGHQITPSESIGEFTRRHLREQSLIRQIMPPASPTLVNQVTARDLDAWIPAAAFDMQVDNPMPEWRDESGPPTTFYVPAPEEPKEKKRVRILLDSDVQCE
jgi:hypothetical protein